MGLADGQAWEAEHGAPPAKDRETDAARAERLESALLWGRRKGFSVGRRRLIAAVDEVLRGGEAPDGS